MNIGICRQHNRRRWKTQISSTICSLSLNVCVLSLSHGNAVPERGFSINKKLIEAHGTTIDNGTIQAQRFGIIECYVFGNFNVLAITSFICRKLFLAWFPDHFPDHLVLLK